VLQPSQDRPFRPGRWKVRRTLATAVLLAASACAAAQAGGAYRLRKQAVVPGGGAGSGALVLSSTLAEAGAGVASGGSFRLTGGFQTPRQALPDTLLADGFE
jgi:hypothetical protein